MSDLSIPYPADLLITSGKTPKELEEELLVLLAVKLFEIHYLTLGKAAEFCGMEKLSFMYELGRLKVPTINLREDQITDELQDDWTRK